MDHPRIQESDRKFAKLEFGGVPIVLVFTKHDSRVSATKMKALGEYNRQNKTHFAIEDVGSMPSDARASIKARAEELLVAFEEALESEWNRKLPNFSSTIFVEHPDFSTQGRMHPLSSFF